MQEGQVEAVYRKVPGAPISLSEFVLRRPPALAVREFVPGNLLYANGFRFKVTHYRFPVNERIAPEVLSIDLQGRRIWQGTPQGYDETKPKQLPVLAIRDSDLDHISHISDEELNRFQMPVLLLGQLQPQHRGGTLYAVGARQMEHLRGQAVRLVNVRPADKCAGADAQIGFPVCGGVRSPYSSMAEINHFIEVHQESCGRPPDQRIGFSSEKQVDALLIRNLDSTGQVANLAEAIRLGAQQVVEMEADDLQVLDIPNGQDKHDLFLYDPMPGGSGLLSQILAQWHEVLEAARVLLEGCPGACETACYDRLKDFHNLFFHTHLDRRLAVKLLEHFSMKPERLMEIPASISVNGAGTRATNTPEFRLEQLLSWHHFPRPEGQYRIQLPATCPIEYTIPDFYFSAPGGPPVAIYLDGLSKGIHGNPKQQMKDRLMRDALEDMGVEVVEVTTSDLADQQARLLFMKTLARKLGRRDLAALIETDRSWDDSR